MLLAMAQAVRAEPDTVPEEPAPDTTTTTTQSRSTYAWEAETDEFGVTLHPPPPDVGGPGNDGPTATTIKTSRTSAPFQINPDHPEDVNTGPVPPGHLLNYTEAVTDIYGNKVTVVITAPPTTETTTEEPATDEEESTEETFPEEPAIPARPLNWTLAAVAGGALVAAAAGGIAVLARNKKDSGDEFIYAEPEDAQPPED